MPVFQSSLSIRTRGRGTYEITGEIARELKKSGLRKGTAIVFCRHTSCSLVLMENADPSARADLERFLNELVPEDYPGFQHTIEGADDMPSHIKTALTRSGEMIPFSHGRLLLGTWQGIFLWEHRRASHNREIQLTFHGE